MNLVKASAATSEDRDTRRQYAWRRDMTVTEIEEHNISIQRDYQQLLSMQHQYKYQNNKTFRNTRKQCTTGQITSSDGQKNEKLKSIMKGSFGLTSAKFLL